MTVDDFDELTHFGVAAADDEPIDDVVVVADLRS